MLSLLYSLGYRKGMYLMKNVNELIPENELRIVLEALIKKEHDRCLDSIEIVNKMCASDYDGEYPEEMVSYYRRRLEELAAIYQRLFSKDIYR